MIFLVLFQIHFVSEHLSSIIIEFCIILLGDLRPGINIPTSLTTLCHITGFSALTDSLRKYVACSRCHCLFILSDPNCPTTCPNNDIRYPNTCANNLFRTVGNHRRPIKEFAYQPLSASIERLFLRPGFEAKIEEWRTRTRVENSFFDVFDGDMWRQFRARNGSLFVDQHRCKNWILRPKLAEPKKIGIWESKKAVTCKLREIKYKWERFFFFLLSL